MSQNGKDINIKDRSKPYEKHIKFFAKYYRGSDEICDLHLVWNKTKYGWTKHEQTKDMIRNNFNHDHEVVTEQFIRYKILHEEY